METWARVVEGDETTKSMRYSISLIVVMLIAGYFKVVSSDTVTSIITLAAGFIMGKARTQTHVITPIPDRRQNGGE